MGITELIRLQTLIWGGLLVIGLRHTPSRNAFKSTGSTDVVNNVVKSGGCLHQNMIWFHRIVSIVDYLEKRQHVRNKLTCVLQREKSILIKNTWLRLGSLINKLSCHNTTAFSVPRQTFRWLSWLFFFE